MVVEHPQEIPRGQSQDLAPTEQSSGRIQQGRDDAIRSLAQALEQQATVAKVPSDTPTKKPKGFDALPAATQKMILFATERDEHGRTATKPTNELSSMFELPNVSHIVNHLHSFVRNKRGCAVRFPQGSARPSATQISWKTSRTSRAP